jgi:glycine cleavage system aminomethyltransferase T
MTDAQRALRLSPSARLRRSPYHDATLQEGAASFTLYNGMLMPTGYGQPEAEYWRLLRGVSQWDVAVERQVQLQGPDAARLAQLLSPRDLSKMVVGQGKYVPLCNHDGVLINDPIALKIADDCYWFSIADSNIWFWARAIAAERGLRVTVSEPDVSPMALQGPKAEDVIAHVFGDAVRSLKPFWFQEASLQGIPLLVARSGWSKQGGFELYLRDGARGNELWRLVREAGKPWDIGPGNPNWCERIESGLLSWGGDTDEQTNPFEVRLSKYVDLQLPDEVVGLRALRAIAAEGPKRQQLGVVLDGAEPLGPNFEWLPIAADGRALGHMTNSVWSYRLRKNIGFALVAAACRAGDAVQVLRGAERLEGQLVALPFL